MTNVKIGLIQPNISFELDKNLEKTAHSVKRLSEKGADFILLPEMFNCPYGPKYFPKFAESQEGRTFQTLSDLARENQVYLIGGSIPELEGKNIYNTSYTFDREGKLINKHRKVHLFDIDVKDGLKFFESESFKPGSGFNTFETEFGTVGVAICFDVRFSQEFLNMADKGARIIFVPSAFNTLTGPAHWQLTMRARALDNQIFMIGAQPARDEDFTYLSYGHSLVIDPWGEVLYEMDEKEHEEIVEIDLDVIEEKREILPIFYGRNPWIKPDKNRK